MGIAEWILLGTASVASAGCAFFVLATRSLASGRESAGRLAEPLGALTLAGGFVCLSVFLLGAPDWSDWVHYVTWSATGAAVLGAASGFVRRKMPRILLAVLLGVMIPALAFPSVRSEWSGLVAASVATSLLGLLGAVVLASTGMLAERRPGPSWPLAWILFAAGVAAVNLLSHYATYAILAAGLASLAALPAAVTLWRRECRFGSASSVALVACGLALLLGGYLHNFPQDRAPALSFLLIGLAPLLPWVGELASLRKSPRLAAVVRVGAVGLAIALALALATFGGGSGEETPGGGGDFDFDDL